VKPLFSLFGDSVNLSARWGHVLRQTYDRLENHFGRTRSYSYVLWVELKVDSVHLEIVLILTQYTVCLEHAIGSKIIFVATDGTLREMG
jgi:hypothetical protein